MTIPKRIAGAVGATALAVALGAGCAWASPAQAGAPDLAAQTRTAQALAAAQAQPLAASFPDVEPGSWYYDSVYNAVGAGLFSGYDDGRFGPNDPLTRAQFAAVMWNHYEPEASAAYDGQAANTTGLPDVQDGQWYTAAVNWAIEDGAMSGYDGGTFGPDDTVTREQACAIIANCSHNHHGSDVEGADTSKLDAMPDAGSVSGWARQSVAWVLNEGVVSGKEVGSQRYVAPADAYTRAEGCAVTFASVDKGLLGSSKLVPSASDFTFTAPSSPTYDGSAKAATVTSVREGMGAVTVEYSADGGSTWTSAAPKDAGTYQVRANVAEGGKYTAQTVADVAWTFTVAKAAATLTAAPAANALTYTGSAQALVTAGSTSDGTVLYRLGEDGAYGTAVPQATDAGAYTVHYKVVGDSNHTDLAEASVEVTVAKAPAAFSTAPTANAPTYTGSAQALVTAGATNDGTVQYRLGENGAYGTAIPQATDAGAYTVYYKVVGDANHTDLAEASVEVAVAKRQLSVTGTAVADKDYDGTASAQVTVGSVQGAVPGDDVTVTATASFDDPNSGAGKPVTVTYAISGARAGNYVAPAQETKTASIIGIATQVSGTTVAGKTYDGTTDVAGGDVTLGTLTDGTGTPIADGNVTLAVESATYDSADAGTRTVTVRYKLEGSGAGRYNTPDDQAIGGVAISQKEVAVTWSGTPLIYNGKGQAPTATVSNKALASDDVTVTVAGGGTDANAGFTYLATADSLGGAAAANYKLPDTKPTQRFSIKRKEITVTPSAGQSKEYDALETVSDLTYTSAGTVEGETASFEGELALEDKDYYDAGTYKIVQGSLALANGTGDNKFKASNYTLTVDETVDFTITPIEAKLVWFNCNLTYNGFEQTPTVIVANRIGPEYVSVRVTGGGTNVGTYTATADSLGGDAAGNYKLPATKLTSDFTIEPLEAAISWSDTSFTYNGSVQAPTATVSNLAATSDVVTVTVTGGQTNAGDYKATAYSLGGADAANYQLSANKPTKNFTIAQKEIAITPTAGQSKAYDGTGTVSGLTYTSAGAVEGEAAAFDGALALEDKGSYVVGTYKFAKGTLKPKDNDSGNFKASNYTLKVDDTVDFTITQRVVELTWSNDSFTYDGSEHAPTATVNNKVGSDVVTVGVTGGKTNAGTYTATADSLDGAAVSNYQLPTTKPTHSFTIGKADWTFSYENVTVKLGTDYVYYNLVYKGTLTAVSADETIAEATVKNGALNIKPIAVGDTTITLTASGDENYIEKSITFTVTVTDD